MISDFAQKVFQELDRKMPALKEMFPKKELQAAVQSALGKMDVVTREEFDAQAAVLQRTRERLEKLEQQLTELEQSQKSD
ncbi:accessory factor UbiK family protein [Marinimicrobium agarilyticum]|uniref:accessory factor UbiK family protein n=1 Tax=Marinimicrobium agarilyticum TaxID=306546 RepID=UPI0003F94739|nr:accessory factor UbiK family protein [Marinimicrobium agarilyticum]